MAANALYVNYNDAIVISDSDDDDSTFATIRNDQHYDPTEPQSSTYESTSPCYKRGNYVTGPLAAPFHDSFFDTNGGVDVLLAHIRPLLGDTKTMGVLNRVNKTIYNLAKQSPAVYKNLIVSLTASKDNILHMERWVREVKPKSIENITLVCGKNTTMQKINGYIHTLVSLGLGTDKITKLTLKNCHEAIEVGELLTRFPNLKHLYIEKPRSDVNFPNPCPTTFDTVAINFGIAGKLDEAGMYPIVNIGPKQNLKTRAFHVTGNCNIMGTAIVDDFKLSLVDHGIAGRMHNYIPEFDKDRISFRSKGHIHVTYTSFMAKVEHFDHNYAFTATNTIRENPSAIFTNSFKTCSRHN